MDSSSSSFTTPDPERRHRQAASLVPGHTAAHPTTAGLELRDLRELPRSASESPPPEHPLRDGPDVSDSLLASSTDEPTNTPSSATAMSRSPLLIRSSPAAGTGSYGGLPVHLVPNIGSLDSDGSPEDSDDIPTARKGKNPLRHSEPTGSGLHISGHGYNVSAIRSIRSEGSKSKNGHRHSKTEGEHGRRAMSETVRDSLEGQHEQGSEDRFTTGMSTAPANMSTGFDEHIHTNGSLEEDSTSDDSWESNDYAVNDKAGNPNMDQDDPPDNSPYSQVRASVPPTDDTSLSINTPRMWALSILFAIFGSSTNLFFSLRYPSVSITPVIALLLAHPLGLLWDRFLKRGGDPPDTFVNGSLEPGSVTTVTPLPSDVRPYDTISSRTGRPRATAEPLFHHQQSKEKWTRRLRLRLAQGSWNEKEHCCVFIASNVSFGFAFATDVSNTTNRINHS